MSSQFGGKLPDLIYADVLAHIPTTHRYRIPALGTIRGRGAESFQIRTRILLKTHTQLTHPQPSNFETQCRHCEIHPFNHSN